MGKPEKSEKKYKQPEDVPVPKTGGYPAKGVEKATWTRRGTHLQTKAKKGAGPLA